MIYAHIISTPVGPLTVVVDTDGALVRLAFSREDGSPDPLRGLGETVHAAERCARVAQQLDEYFRGERTQFDLGLAPAGTSFQLRVWEQLRRVPYGETLSYGELAARVGNPAASRAVGRANAANPLPIVVPCHRIIGADGSLTGFGGGIGRKQWLLKHEAAVRLRDSDAVVLQLL